MSNIARGVTRTQIVAEFLLNVKQQLFVKCK